MPLPVTRNHTWHPEMMMIITQLPERSLRLPEVQQLVPYSKMHIDRLEKAGEFPRRIKLGAGRVVWKQSEILAWVESKRAEPNVAA
jgi:prophage regulatory protein